MTRIALVSDDLDLERRLFQGLGPDRYVELVTVLEPVLANVEARVAATGADVVLFGPRLDAMEALVAAERIDAEHPGITTLIVTAEPDELWELALRAGVRAVLPMDLDPSRFRDEIERALEVADRRRKNLVIDLRSDEPVVSSVPTGRVITVLSPKGGSGKTTIATNLAAGLAMLAPEGVAIVDLDLQFGDVADALALSPEHTLEAACGRAAHLDSAELKILLTAHTSGLYALCAPDDPAAGEAIEGADVAAALDVLMADFPFVIVDTAAGVDEAALTAIERSTDLVFVAAMDVPSIRNLRKLVAALDRLGIDGPTRHLVLNRSDTRVGISVADVEATLRMPIAVAVPSSRTIPMSVNHGTPILTTDTKSPAVKPLRDLVARFTDTPTARGGLSLFRRSAR